MGGSAGIQKPNRYSLSPTSVQYIAQAASIFEYHDLIVTRIRNRIHLWLYIFDLRQHPHTVFHASRNHHTQIYYWPLPWAHTGCCYWAVCKCWAWLRCVQTVGGVWNHGLFKAVWRWKASWKHLFEDWTAPKRIVSGRIESHWTNSQTQLNATKCNAEPRNTNKRNATQRNEPYFIKLKRNNVQIFVYLFNKISSTNQF